MKGKSYIFVIIAAALWGTIGIYSKQLSTFGFSILQIVSIRAIFSTLAILTFILFKDKRLLKIEIRDFTYFVGTGIISFVFFNWCYFIAINKTSLSAAAILLYTAPVFVMVFSSILFKEKMTKRKIAALILTFIGCVFVTASAKGTAQNISALGILAGLGSGLGYALYSIFGRYALKKYDSITVTFYTFVFASVGLIPISNIKGFISLFSNINAVYYAILLGLLATVLPFMLYTKGLSHLETSKASIIATLEPVVATVVGIALFREPITIFKIIGILVVVLAVSMLVEKYEDNFEEKYEDNFEEK
ncbi:MAG TPA: EamA family transporter [Clostridia bacterium]|nr:EamA family transporter [Clostridia bacterium]